MLQDDGYRADVEALRETCAERGVAVQTIKAVARRRWTADDPRRATRWYEPLRDAGAVGRAVRFVLAQPDLFLNSSSDGQLLRPILEAAGGDDATVAPSDAELAGDLDAFDMRAALRRRSARADLTCWV